MKSFVKYQEFQPLSDRLYIKEWVENRCDGGSLIVKNFYLKKEELDQQSLNCAARKSFGMG